MRFLLDELMTLSHYFIPSCCSTAHFSEKYLKTASMLAKPITRTSSAGHNAFRTFVPEVLMEEKQNRPICRNLIGQYTFL